MPAPGGGSGGALAGGGAGTVTAPGSGPYQASVPADFGSNVLIFDPSMGNAAIQSKLDGVFAGQETNQFGAQRFAYFFKPGAYELNVQVGFYTHVLGLGMTPEAVTITGAVSAMAKWFQGNATQNCRHAVVQEFRRQRHQSHLEGPRGSRELDHTRRDALIGCCPERRPASSRFTPSCVPKRLTLRAPSVLSPACGPRQKAPWCGCVADARHGRKTEFAAGFGRRIPENSPPIRTLNHHEGLCVGAKLLPRLVVEGETCLRNCESLVFWRRCRLLRSGWVSFRVVVATPRAVVAEQALGMPRALVPARQVLAAVRPQARVPVTPLRVQPARARWVAVAPIKRVPLALALRAQPAAQPAAQVAPAA
jgi:hypothetical protein